MVYGTLRASRRSRRALVLGLCAAMVACASHPSVQAPTPDFNGNWSVQWCGKTDPDADCGGFDVDLTQVGDKISGESFGARARLAQIDEGGVIHGIAIGNTAILTVESLRSGGIYLVEATIEGRCMQWKMRETIRERERDIDIIATNDVLMKSRDTPLEQDPSKKEVGVCDAVLGRKENR